MLEKAREAWEAEVAEPLREEILDVTEEKNLLLAQMQRAEKNLFMARRSDEEPALPARGAALVRQALATVAGHVASNAPLSAALERLGQAVETAASRRDVAELAEAVDEVDNVPVVVAEARPKTPLKEGEPNMTEAHLAAVVSALAHITDGLDALGERLRERGQQDEDISQFIVWARRTGEEEEESMFKRIPVAKKLQKAAKVAALGARLKSGALSRPGSKPSPAASGAGGPAARAGAREDGAVLPSGSPGDGAEAASGEAALAPAQAEASPPGSSRRGTKPVAVTGAGREVSPTAPRRTSPRHGTKDAPEASPNAASCRGTRHAAAPVAAEAPRAAAAPAVPSLERVLRELPPPAPEAGSGGP
ncbi:unnamed protein product, partial [Prorocentrum cordatum]